MKAKDAENISLLLFLIGASTLMSAGFLYQVNGSQTLTFWDDFETCSVGVFPDTWQLWYTGGGVEYQKVVDTINESPTRSLELYGRSGWAAVAAKRFASASDQIKYCVSVRPTSQSHAVVGFAKNFDGWVRYYAMVLFKPNGTIVSGGGNQGGEEVFLQSYTSETWYEVEVTLERSSRKYSVWIDDVLRAAELETYHPTSEIEALALAAGYDVNALTNFDDVGLFEITPPVISDISINPEKPKSDDDVTVTASISDDYSSLEEACLCYSIDQGGNWSRLSMTNEDLLYKAIIPRQAYRTEVSYYVEAIDNANNKAESDKRFYKVTLAFFDVFPLVVVSLMIVLLGLGIAAYGKEAGGSIGALVVLLGLGLFALECLYLLLVYTAQIMILTGGAFLIVVAAAIVLRVRAIFSGRREYEKSQRAMGLVKYKGKWGTQNEVFERQQLEKGLVKHGSHWVTPQEKDMLIGLVELINRKGRVGFTEIATGIEVSVSKVKEFVNGLNDDEMVRGTFALDDSGFTTLDKLKEDLWKQISAYSSLKIMGLIDESKELNVPVAEISRALESLSQEGKIWARPLLAVTGTPAAEEAKEFLCINPMGMAELVKILGVNRISIQELAKKLGVRPCHMRFIISMLLNEKRIRGSFAGNDEFIPNMEIAKFAEEECTKVGKIDIVEISKKLSVCKEGVRQAILEEKGSKVIEKLKTCERITLTELSNATEIPEVFLLALVNMLTSEGELRGPDHSFTRGDMARGLICYHSSYAGLDHPLLRWGAVKDVERWKQEDFETEQRGKGLVKYKGEWMTPREQFEQEQTEKGLTNFVGKNGEEIWGTPEQVQEWKRIEIGMDSNFSDLHPREFERLIARLFEHMGYHVELGSYVKDHGADIILTSSDGKFVVQVKKYQGRQHVGSQEVRQILGAMTYFKASRAVLVTTSDFTLQAKHEAGEMGVDLWNRSILHQMIERYLLR